MLRTPTVEEIVAGGVTDHCGTLGLEVLKRLSLEDRTVTLEAHVRRFPPGLTGAIYCGVNDVMEIVGGGPVEVWSMPSGSVFHEREPVLVLKGTAKELVLIRPTITGILAFASSLVTRATDFVRAADGRPVFFFGSRKLHPAHVLQYLECAYLAGMEINASSLCRYITPDAMLEDCQEHFTNLVADTVEESWSTFAALPPSSGAQFVVLDNIADPIWELKRAVEVLGDRLQGVLLDTDSTRRGDMHAILAEVRWCLRMMHRDDLKVGLTGGVTPELIRTTRHLVSSYGVGIAALSGSWLDFALQVVEVDGTARSKVGVLAGQKGVFECLHCGRRSVALVADIPVCCGKAMEGLLTSISKDSIGGLEQIRERIRQNVAQQVSD